MSSLAIESLTATHLPDLQQLFRVSGPFVSERGPSDYWLYARLFGDSCLVAQQSGRIVGAVLAFRDQSQDLREVYVQDLAVAPEARRRGVGKALMAALIARASDWGTRRIWLTSEPENQAAMRLWEQLGFMNPEADYREGGLWVTRDLKGPGRDRVVFALDHPYRSGNRDRIRPLCIVGFPATRYR